MLTEEVDITSDLVSAVQQGEYGTIREALRKRVASPNMHDAQGCSLLQWAAINNRFAIANLLIGDLLF